MEYRSLGSSGLKVSLHSLGTMNFSGEGFFGMAGQLVASRNHSDWSIWPSTTA